MSDCRNTDTSKTLLFSNMGKEERRPASLDFKPIQSSRPASEAYDALELLAEGESEDFVNVSFPPAAETSLSPVDEAKTFCVEDAGSLTEEDVNRFFDKDGRIVEEHRFRKAVFRSGITPEARRIAWPFLFELYPFHSTVREREILLAEYFFKYTAVKYRWKTYVADKFRYDDEGNKLAAPSYLDELPGSPPPQGAPTSADPSIAQQLQSFKLQAEVYAGRLEFQKSMKDAIHIIDKDVPRTDRNIPYFKGNTVHLRMLRNILITYAASHPELGYTQGMNDILSRFLTVFDSEVEAYWCFEKYMDRMKQHFMRDGIQLKLLAARHLLEELDPDLAKYLLFIDEGHLSFCHRWMLLSFKREFEWEESMKCFEILSSAHLELTGQAALKSKQKHMMRDFQKQGGNHPQVAVGDCVEYTFEVFMCVSILIESRNEIFQCQEASDIYALAIRKADHMELRSLLRDAEVLFYKYLQKSAENSFVVVNAPSTSSPKHS